MEATSREEVPDFDQLSNLTSDALAACTIDGSIIQINQRFLDLVGESRKQVLGTDIKDKLFSESFERAEFHQLPFTIDGTDNTCMLKLADGSFIPVLARAVSVKVPERLSARLLKRGHAHRQVLIAMHSLEERYAHDRQMRRVLSELQVANKRLSGTLSVIMSTVGSESLPTLLDTVLNKLVDALDADGTTIYFSEGGGFKLRGISQSLNREYVPEFIPYGVGVPTYVLRKGSSCRLSIVRAEEGTEGSFYDLDARRTVPLRAHYMPPFRTLISVPVFFGTQILGVIELGWKRPVALRSYDVNVIEVVCDYLSIELMSLATSMRSQRMEELNRSLNHVRDIVYNAEGNEGFVWAEMVGEIRRVLSCHVCPLIRNPKTDMYELDFEGGNRVPLPGDVDQLFFSTTVPAARVNVQSRSFFGRRSGEPELRDSDLEHIRLTRIERQSRVGKWLNSRGLPDQGVFFELGDFFDDIAFMGGASGAPGAGAGVSSGAFAGGADRGAGMGAGGGADRDASAESGADAGTGSHMADAGSAGEAAGETPTQALALSLDSLIPRMFLLLRDDSQEPIDDIEYDYLVRLSHDFELRRRDMTQHTETTHIAQTLQAGMRSSLGDVPGIISDSLYSSATRQALVGGDFYTLIRLPDDCAMMILGDVSGKGVEAASMSALVKTALTAYAWEEMSPVRMVRALNSMLMGFSRVEVFATMFVAKLDLRTGTATYCSAGHPPSILLRCGCMDTGERSCEAELLSVQSGVVGAFETMTYEEGEFSFSAGDVLFMYTDGAIEARSTTGEFFGEQRLRDLLLAHAGKGAPGLCQRVLDELDAFTDSALEDDIALVALEFAEPACRGGEGGSAPSAAARGTSDGASAGI